MQRGMEVSCFRSKWRPTVSWFGSNHWQLCCALDERHTTCQNPGPLHSSLPRVHPEQHLLPIISSHLGRQQRLRHQPPNLSVAVGLGAKVVPELVVADVCSTGTCKSKHL